MTAIIATIALLAIVVLVLAIITWTNDSLLRAFARSDTDLRRQLVDVRELCRALSDKDDDQFHAWCEHDDRLDTLEHAEADRNAKAAEAKAQKAARFNASGDQVAKS